MEEGRVGCGVKRSRVTSGRAEWSWVEQGGVRCSGNIL